MFSKKIKIVIIGISIIFFAVIIFFIWKSREKDIVTNNTPILKELKSIHPEFNEAQIKFYSDAAAQKDHILEPCHEREDERDCISAVSFIRGNTTICDELEGDEGRIECANPIVSKGIDTCWRLEGDDFINCAIRLFRIYEKEENCMKLGSEIEQEKCQNTFRYETAFLQYNKELCAQVKDEKLNQYCLENIIEKSQDTDSDGLTDLDEINIYRTKRDNPDTDTDGYSDSEEIKNGYNPRGAGKLEK